MPRGRVPESKLQLFRQEIIDQQASNWFGPVRLAQPVAVWIVVALSVLVGVAIVAFVALGTVTRKARVTGLIVPEDGTVSIAATNPGILTHVYVKEGARVNAGEALFEISSERQNSQGELTQLLGKRLEQKSRAIEREKQAKIRGDIDKQNGLEAKLRNLDAEDLQLDLEITMARSRLGLGKISVDQFDSLSKQGFASSAQAQQKHEDVIDLEARLSTLLRNKIGINANRLSFKAEKEDEANSIKSELAQIDQSVASLEQEIIENRNRRSTLIVAPNSGVVTAITYHGGQTIANGQVLATLLPGKQDTRAAENQLEAHVFLTSRTSGFIEIGQSVNLKFHAFPYQKFGMTGGQVIDIGRTPFAPAELPANLASTILSNAQQPNQGGGPQESLYRVKVKLNSQSVMAYGEQQKLRPGMTFEAEINQDKRRIWEWIAEPVIAVAR